MKPNISFLFFKKLSNWGQNYKYNLQSGGNWNLHGQNWWPDLKFGIANFGLQKDNGANFKDSKIQGQTNLILKSCFSPCLKTKLGRESM